MTINELEESGRLLWDRLQDEPADEAPVDLDSPSYFAELVQAATPPILSQGQSALVKMLQRKDDAPSPEIAEQVVAQDVLEEELAEAPAALPGDLSRPRSLRSRFSFWKARLYLAVARKLTDRAIKAFRHGLVADGAQAALPEAE